MRTRRLKRIKMCERGVRCIWRRTPSPPAPEKARILEEREAAFLARQAQQAEAQEAALQEEEARRAGRG
ncbi:hypothetical protein H632_c409p0, partial [Helicosporidium sp. ATCC 50920]